MGWMNKLRQQKLLTFTLLVFTLSIGILIGTLVNTGVNAAKSQGPAPDAMPLVIPPASQISNEFSKLAKRLEPSVVYISTDYKPKAIPGHSRPNGGEDEDGEEGLDLFRRFFRNNPGGESIPRRHFRQHGTGSGVIVDKNGYIITNYHVVDGADHITVKMPHDESEHKARLIGSDLETDLAVIKIDAGRALLPVRIGNSEAVQVGDWAIAIGAPFGLEATVTAGIVSATGRDITGARQFQRFIQTDAAINPGNSGGPLLNINGEVIGINTAIATENGGYQGVGFALPVNTAVTVYNAIITTGKMARGSIGIQFNKYPKSQELLKALGLKEGVLVEKVTAGGPAEKAGLKGEDVIVAFNGKPIRDGDDLVSRVSQSPIGSRQTLTVDRDGKRFNFTVTIGDREQQLIAAGDLPAHGAEADPPSGAAGTSDVRFGLGLRPVNEGERQAAKLENQRGMVITRVEENSFAEELGLIEKDIILSINRQSIVTLEDIKRIQAKLKPGDPVAFRVLRPTPLTRRAAGPAQYNGFYVAGTLPRGR